VRSIVERAIKSRVHAVLVAGDVLDQPALQGHVKSRCEHFLLNEVVGPLRAGGIRLVLTLGSHDWVRGNPKRDSSLRVLRALAGDNRGHVELLVPPGVSGRKSLEVGNLRIATDPPGNSWRGEWIEFLHDQAESRGGSPVYRCYGDKHILWIDSKRRRYHPGSPLARTTAADGGGAGPRHALLVTVAPPQPPDVRPLRLPVMETAVLKWSGDGWSVMYERDYERHRWRRNALRGEGEQVAQLLASKFPSLGWLTFLAKDYPKALPAPESLGDTLRGRSPHLLSVWMGNAT